MIAILGQPDDTCDFYDCNEPICQTDKELKEGLKFCQAHSIEAAGFIQAEDIPGLLTFWVRSYGGAERMAKRIV